MTYTVFRTNGDRSQVARSRVRKENMNEVRNEENAKIERGSSDWIEVHPNR
jgi:hypothetical protein